MNLSINENGASSHSWSSNIPEDIYRLSLLQDEYWRIQKNKREDKLMERKALAAPCMFHNYRALDRRFRALFPLVKQTVSYFMTFKPFNKNYDPKFNALDHVRKKIYLHNSGHIKAVIISREITAKKVHYNAIVFSTKCLLNLDNKQTNRFKIYCKMIDKNTESVVHEYITKESKTRYFEKNDYKIISPYRI